ncbi:MAG: hypothetical protein KAJ19_04060 [Gammaproteobacteria bacterium]|nr:hypothetical protein [Gammaproteobacteria bacterium]
MAQRIQSEIDNTSLIYIESKIQVDAEVGLIELSEQHTSPEELINAALLPGSLHQRASETKPRQ